MNTFTYHLGRLIAHVVFAVFVVLVMPASILLIAVSVGGSCPVFVVLFALLAAYGDGRLWYKFWKLTTAMTWGSPLPRICRRLLTLAIRVALVHMLAIVIAAFAARRFCERPADLMTPLLLVAASAVAMLVPWWVLCEQSRWGTDAAESLHT